MQQSQGDDPRLGSLVQKVSLEDDLSGFSVVVLGFPHDEGVRRNGGRVGARDGPRAFRDRYPRVGALNNLEVSVDLLASGIRVADAGDVGASLGLEEAHAALAAAVARVLSFGAVPYVVGGGNDQSAAVWDGWMRHRGSSNGTAGVINVDAHLDVRPLKEGLRHSGSPFRLVIEDANSRGVSLKFVEFACQGAQCSASHAQYVVQNGGQLRWLSHLRHSVHGVVGEFSQLLENLADDLFVSFDIDSISGSDCPGVSAPATVGLSADEALQICFEAGRHPKVCLFDTSEFNPLIEEQRTARLVSMMFYHFLLGIASRSQCSE